MLKWISKKRNRKGFTLVELVVVIAILGILAAIAVPKLSSSRKNAAISAHKANVRTLQSAANMFIADDWDGSEDTWDGTDDQAWEDYLQEWPDVPTGLEEDAEYEVTITDQAEITVTPAANEYD